MTTTDARDFKILFLGWAMLVAAGVLLLLRYGHLPDLVPLYRVPGTGSALLGPKTPATVGRIFAMGLGQVGAASIMVRCAWRDDGWRRFWAWAMLAAGAKTLFECLELATISNHAYAVLAGGVVLAFLVAAATWWRRGALAGAVNVDPVSRVGLVASLGLWASAAILPRFL